jgi:hypothetical protein
MLKAAHISALTLLAALAIVGLAQGQAASGSSPASAASSPPASSAPVVLDRVVAVINGGVILESDVENEMRFAVLQPGRANPAQNTQQNALRRLIDRDLILQQMKATRIVKRQASAEEIHRQIESLRKSIPECAQYHCVAQAGWNAFLAAHDLTEEQIEARWRQRITILAFIQTRFGAGVRISDADIDQYYRQDLVPEFAKRHLPPPPLGSVSARIHEILLQQRVNVLLQDWLQSLKEEGSVSILSPAYAQVGSAEGAASGPGAEPRAGPGADPGPDPGAEP